MYTRMSSLPVALSTYTCGLSARGRTGHMGHWGLGGLGAGVGARAIGAVGATGIGSGFRASWAWDHISR